MSATKAQINWSTVLNGSAPITRITSGGFDQGGELIRFKGDTDRYSSIIANVNNEPSCQFTSADIGTLMGFVPGASTTVTAILVDALAASGGNVLFSMINAVFESAGGQDQHANFGVGTATWQAYASDGLTNPLTFTRA